MQHAKFRWWMLTWNNPPEDWKSALLTLKADYVLGQLERGENGTVHIQAVCWFRQSVRPTHWQGLAVWSKGLSSEAAIERVTKYCQKDETRLDGPFENGTRPFKRNSKTDWDQIRSYAKEGRFEEIPSNVYITCYSSLKKIHAEFGQPIGTPDVRGVWIYGPPGVGKSHYAIHHYPEAYRKAQNKWFDGYTGHNHIILDDVDKLGSCLAHYFKIWLDKWPCYGEVKGGTVALRHEKFVITSNYLPSDLWPEDSTLVEAIERRLIFIHIPTRHTIRIGQTAGTFPTSIYMSELNSFLNLDS